MFTSCCTLSFTVESMASNKVRTPVNLVAWLSLDRLWLLDQWTNVLQMNGDTTSECPIRPKWGCRRTSIDVLHTSMEVRTSKEVRTLICGRPPPVKTPSHRGPTQAPHWRTGGRISPTVHRSVSGDSQAVRQSNFIISKTAAWGWMNRNQQVSARIDW